MTGGDEHNRIAHIVYDTDNNLDPEGGRDPACRAFGKLLMKLLYRHNVPADHKAWAYALACTDGTTLVGSATAVAAEAGVTLLELEAIARLAATQPTTEDTP